MMVAPVLISIVPAALEIMRIALTADENAKRHEIARAELAIQAIRERIEASRIALERDRLETQFAAYTMLLDALRSTFKAKSDMVHMIVTVVLSQHEAEKDALRGEKERLNDILLSPDMRPDRYVAARRGVAQARERERELDGRFADQCRLLNSTILALAPGDFAALDRLRGYLG